MHNKDKNRESIRDATAELQVKIIWSCFILAIKKTSGRGWGLISGLNSWGI